MADLDKKLEEKSNIIFGLERLGERSKILTGVEIGMLLGLGVGVISYFTNQDPELTKTIADSLNLVGDPIPEGMLYGYCGGWIYSKFKK